MEEEGTQKAVFDGVCFSVMPSDELSVAQVNGLIDALQQGGALHIPLRSSDHHVERLLDLTHIISTHVDFPQYSAVLEHNVAVVKPSWVIQSVHKQKQASPRQHSPDPNQFFQDCVVTSAELPEGDRDAIIAGVIALGGQYSSPLTKLVTHIVTTGADHPKITLAIQKQLRCRVVLPHWFDDCLKLGKKISERPYCFPDPEVLRNDKAPIRSEPNPRLQGATQSRPEGPLSFPNTPPSSSAASLLSSPSTIRKNLNAFMNKKVMFSKDLDLSEHLLKTFGDLINRGGGTLTDSVEQADIFIGEYRDGPDYAAASRARKEVANLSWLYQVINRNKYTSPQSRLLHYPVPRQALPGFEHMKISISNYTGDARIYLENLIRHSGAEFTKTMKQDNTHLIAAHKNSDKVDAAQEWNINIINHLWMEESYAKCAVQSLTNPRYQTFPPRTDLSEVVGQTSLDLRKVEQMFFPKIRTSPGKAAQPPVAGKNAKSSPRKTIPASSAIHTSTPHGAHQVTAPTPIAEDAETDDERETADTKKLKKTPGRPRKPATETPRLTEDEKENQSPLWMSSGRASKAKALDVMHQQASDIALFQKEMKRKGGVTHGGTRSSHAEKTPSSVPTVGRTGKRKSDDATYNVTAEGCELSDGETQELSARTAKKTKRGSSNPGLPPIQYKVMVTGFERWVGKPRQEDTDRRKLRLLGVQVTQDAKEVDILVAPKIMRTRKFVCALASAPLVVDTRYLETALKQGKLVSNPKLLHDRETEGQLGFQLAESLERAKINQGKLLRGWSILVTKEISGGYETYRDIITVNGGASFMYTGRTGWTLPKRRLRNDPEAGSESQHQGGDDEFDFLYLVSGESESEVRCWKTLRAHAKKQDLDLRIVRSDWLLNAAMNQEIRWDEKWAHVETEAMD